MMTVKELRQLLATYPPDALVLRSGGEYRGDERLCVKVVYREHPTYGTPGNTVLID